MPPELIVKVVGDTSALERSYARGRRDTTAFGSSFKGLTRELDRSSRGALSAAVSFRGLGRSLAFASSSFLGGAGAVFAIKAASSAASNLNEQASKTQIVFGKATAAVTKFSNDALGLAKDEALETASTFGALLKPLGILPGRAAALSVELTKLGVDLSSFFNTSTADALDAIKSGLVGESEPLRRFGVLLSEARVQQEAFRETGKTSAAQLTQTEKVLARLTLIFKDSAQASGDYARTIGGLANQQRELHKNIRNLEIAVGGALNPAILDVTKSLNAWLSESKNQDRVTRDVAEAVDIAKSALEGIAAVVTPLASAFKTLGTAVGGTRNEVELLGAAFLAFKATKLLDGIGLIGSTAKTSKGEVNLLRASLLRLGALGLITVGIEVLLNKDAIQKGVAGFLDQHGLGAFSGTNNISVQDILSGKNLGFLSDSQRKTLFELAKQELKKQGLILGPPAPKGFKAGGGALSIPDTAGGQFRFGAPAGLSAAQQFQLSLAASPDSLKLLREQAQKDRNAIAFANKLRNEGRISNKNYVATVLAYQADLNSTLDHISAVVKAAADNVKRLSIPEGRIGGFARFRQGIPRRIGGEFQQLAASFTTPAGLRLDEARAEARGDTAGILAAVRKMRTAAQKALRSGKLSLDATLDALNAITDANTRLKQTITGDVTKFRHVSSAKLLQGLGLSRDEFRAARARVSVLGPGGTIPGSSAAFGATGGGGINFNAPVTNQFYGVTDMRAMEEQLEKRAKSRPQVRRGAR